MSVSPRKTVISTNCDPRTNLSVEAIKRDFLANLFYIEGKFPQVASEYDYYMAVAATVRDRIMHRWINTVQTYFQKTSRTVCYLSAEFLLGPQLGNNMINLGIYENTKQAMKELDLDLDSLLEQEEEPGLGNGGLGRLAACFLDSLATLEIPTIGYGIRYEFGIFDQSFHDGWQVERTDKWLRLGNPWEIPRPEINFEVKFGGYTKHTSKELGKFKIKWIPEKIVKGIAYDIPIVGYHVNTAVLLRLWKSEATESFDFQTFNMGNYYGAVYEKIFSENITKVLYPNDEPLVGKELRLQQQYFFVSCSLQDMIRIHLQTQNTLETFANKYTIQLNDTHPAIGVAELMRLLLDEHHLLWDQAWSITQKTFNYTNHTLLPEALEKWSISLFERLLPRHLEIIYEINQRFLDSIRIRYPMDDVRLARLSLIDETGERYIRMAHLACVGSYKINGVAKLHTELLENTVLKDFYEIMPEKFNNKTNGVTPRRFMVLSNPNLSQLLDEVVGTDWPVNIEKLQKLEDVAEDRAFQEQWYKVKLANKTILANRIKKSCGYIINPESLFDVQVKRIHEYKRQHLNILHVISLYQAIKEHPQENFSSRTFMFGGKAAPGYFMAKLIIKLINSVAEVINNDPEVQDKLKVIFFPNFNVKRSHWIYPAADVSEQISTAGKEASGTGNMKFAFNGALTVGTLDGANIEIRDRVGAENFYLCGLTAEEVEATQAAGYEPMEYYQQDPQLKAAIDLIDSGFFSHGDRTLYRPFLDNLLYSDPYLVLADFSSYVTCQGRIGRDYQNKYIWQKRSILNTARMSYFSSDRTIKEYAKEIWQVESVPVQLMEIEDIINL